MDNSEIVKALQKLAHTTQNNPFHMLNLAASDPRVAITLEDFDTNPYFLNAKNCLVDLKTGLALPHNSAYLITKQCNANFLTDAQCPLWMEFLNYVTENDQSLIDYLARMFGGVGLVGDNPERALVILFGYGKNGKSVFADVIRHVMGSYSDILRQEVITIGTTNNKNHDIADLKGARFLLASEPPPGVKLNGSVIKELTGGDQIKGRHIYQHSVKFRCEGLITLVTNWEPEIEAGDNALKQRLHFVRFNRIISPEKCDPLLGEKLKLEADGILAWLVRGRMDYLDKGLATPERVLNETLAYNTDADWLELFLNTICKLDSECKEQAEKLYVAYSRYMFDQMQTKSMLPKQKFFNLLARRFGKTHIKGLTYYSGISLL
jgi:putative DNA primase/helicase